MIQIDLYACMAVLLLAEVSIAGGSVLCQGTRIIDSTPTRVGHIAAPNNPRSYPAQNMQCTFKFLPRHDEQVQLSFAYFNLRESPDVPAFTNCDLSDSVKVIIGPSSGRSVHEVPVGEYCGKKFPEVVMAVGRPLTVQFTVRAKEDPLVNSIYTFKASYKFSKDYSFKTHAQQNCSAGCHFIFDGRMVPKKGEFSSPNFGSLYPFTTNCLYTFKAYGNQSIRLSFTKFEVEGQKDCWRSDDDMLQIVEGDYNWATFSIPPEDEPAKRNPNATLYCGVKSPPDLYAKEQTVHVVFKSGQWRTKHGFLGTYVFAGHPGSYISTTPQSAAAARQVFSFFSAFTIFWCVLTAP